MSIESVKPSKHLILCHLLLLPSIFPGIRVFSKESVLRIRWPKYWSFNFSINPSNEYSGLISFRIDWLDLLAVQGTLKSPLQHHSSKASILPHSAFFPQPLVTINLLPISTDLPILDISYKWNHIVYGFSCLVSSIQHNVFKIHPCQNMYFSSSFLLKP